MFYGKNIHVTAAILISVNGYLIVLILIPLSTQHVEQSLPLILGRGQLPHRTALLPVATR